MREVFAPDQARPANPGRVFYTIRAEDAGKRVIATDIGPVFLADVIGRVLPCDVGKRLYRVPVNDRSHWIWQCESAGQRDKRLRLKPVPC